MDAVLLVVGLGKLAAPTGAGWLWPDGRDTVLRCIPLFMNRASGGDGLIVRAISLQGVVRWWLLSGGSRSLCIQAVSLLSAGLGCFPDEKFQFRNV